MSGPSRVRQRAFDRVRLLMTTTPVLVHPDFSLPFHVHCDALRTGHWRSAISKRQWSKPTGSLPFEETTPHQQNWSPAQLESYAVYYCVCVNPGKVEILSFSQPNHRSQRPPELRMTVQSCPEGYDWSLVFAALRIRPQYQLCIGEVPGIGRPYDQNSKGESAPNCVPTVLGL